MPRTILITGAAKTDRLRIRNVLRRGFRQSVIQVNDDAGLFGDGLLVVSAGGSAGTSDERDGDLQGKIQRAEFLLETAKALASPKELDQALWDVAERSREILGETAFVFLLERGEPELRCAASTPADQLTRIMTALINTGSQAKAKLREVFESGRELLINDLSLLDLPQELRGLIDQFGFMSLMAVPIKKEDEVYGVFLSIATAPKRFEEWQLRLGVELAEAIARAVSQARLFVALKQQANTDGDTGLYNKRFFDEVLHREVARAERHRLPLALLLLDVDDFKRVNDVYGHLAGDHTLKTLADIFHSSVRREDFVFRCGGDEFAVLLPDTGIRGAQHVAETIRGRVEAAAISPASGLKVTISIGVSEHELSFKENGGAPETGGVNMRPLDESVRLLLERADSALYSAKRDRKNKVEIYRVSSPTEPSL